MSQHYDVLVVGGGVVGLTAALAMSRGNTRVAVVDAGSLVVDSSQADLRVYAVNKTSQALLTDLGVWSLLPSARLSPYEHMHVWDGASGAHIDFDSREVASAYLGTIIEESLLKQALLSQIARHSNIDLVPQTAIEAVEEDSTGMIIHSGDKRWHGRLLMVADGANSATRAKLKVNFTCWSYEQQALVATVRIGKPHQKTAYQVFHNDGPLALLPLAEPLQCSIVWSADLDRAKSLLACSEAEFNQQINHAFGPELGAIELSSTRHHFPLHMRHVKQYVGAHWLILGDAAHTIHPLAGLGLNLGLADVACWLSCYAAHRHKLPSSRALGAYQRQRKHAVWQTIMLMEGFKRLFGSTNSTLISARSLGLRACNSTAALKRMFIEHAQG